MKGGAKISIQRMKEIIIEQAHETGTYEDGRRWYQANSCSVGLEYGRGAYDTEARMVRGGILRSDPYTMQCVLTVRGD